jgi:hypothetical protein
MISSPVLRNRLGRVAYGVLAVAFAIVLLSWIVGGQTIGLSDQVVDVLKVAGFIAAVVWAMCGFVLPGLPGRTDRSRENTTIQ